MMSSLKVYYPENFNALVNLMSNGSNNYIIYNEIDYKNRFLELENNKNEFRSILLVNDFEKFGKISLKGNFLEMGPCVTYGRIMDFGKKNIPRLFYEFISKIKDKVMLNSINLSNGFYLQGSIFDAFPLFLILDAQFEFKSIESKKTYTVHSYDIDRKEYIQNKDKILLSKIKIPITSSWNRSYYYRTFFDSHLPENFENNNLIFICVLLNIKKDFISDFLIKIFFEDKVFALKDFQLFLLNKTLPLAYSEIESSLAALSKNIKDIKYFNTDDTNFKLIKNFYVDILMNLVPQF